LRGLRSGKNGGPQTRGPAGSEKRLRKKNYVPALLGEEERGGLFLDNFPRDPHFKDARKIQPMLLQRHPRSSQENENCLAQTQLGRRVPRPLNTECGHNERSGKIQAERQYIAKRPERGGHWKRAEGSIRHKGKKEKTKSEHRHASLEAVSNLSRNSGAPRKARGPERKVFSKDQPP